MKTLKEQIEVMQAALDGKKIEVKLNSEEEWVEETPFWNWLNCDYRVKQEPRIFWIAVWKSGGVTKYNIKPSHVDKDIIEVIEVQEILR